MATKHEITGILSILSASYPRFKMEKETVATYVLLLKDIPADELKIAALDCATKRDFFPSVHELRETVINLRRRSAKLPTSYEAWNEVISVGRGYWAEAVMVEDGYAIEHKSYEWTHPVVEKVARLLGWPKKFPGENLVADRANFIKAYDQTINNAVDYEITIPEVKQFIESKQPSQLFELLPGRYDEEENDG